MPDQEFFFALDVADEPEFGHMIGELMAVVGMANETNRLASGYQVEIDEQFKQ